ncbi:ABC transporter substrate-binding protein [Jatrophihabitans fulvus]
MKRIAATLAASALALAASACSSSDDSGGGDALRVTTIGLCNEQIAWGIDQKMFGDQKIELVPVQSGAAALASLQAGEADIAFVNSLTSFTAINKGQKVKIISDTGLSTKGANGLVVKKGGDVKSVKDLQGKTIATNILGGLGQVMTDYWIQKETGQKSTAKWTQLPFDQLLPAVTNGKIAAAQVAAAQVVQGEKDGSAVNLGNPFFATTGPVPTAFYLAGTDWIEKNKDKAETFTKGIEKASQSANDPKNDDKRFPVMAKYCKSTPEAVASEPEATFEGLLTMSAYDSLVSVLKKAGAITDKGLDGAVADFAVK